MMFHILVLFAKPSCGILYIAFLASLISPIFSMQLSAVNSKLCSSLCQCTSKTVDCNHQDGLAFIPSRITEEFNQLHISHAYFKDRGLSKINFTTITHLTSLKIIYSKLETLSDDTFILMDRLQFMDISHNRFTVIEVKAFNGLNLINLYLEGNQGGLQIYPNMFSGLKVTNLYLRSNGITKISVTTFEYLNIAKLYLFNNSITTIDRNFGKLFSSSDKLLDLTKNQLYCSCGLSWFPDLVNRWNAVPSFVKITCSTPVYLQERLISSLKKDEFFCETPSINKISVDVSENFVHLICYAKGNTPPKISWTRVNSDAGGQIPNIEEMTTVNHQSYVSINVSVLQNDNSFMCRTWNEINSSNQVLVKLKLVDDFFAKRKKSTPSFERNDENFNQQLPRNPNPPTHFLFTKQFSILQMIGAVVGTFTSVIILIFIICCTQEHLMKKNSNSNPYWTIIPTDLKNSSNRVVAKSPISPSMAMVSSSNGQDYDIPQYHESNNFLQSYYTERNTPHYVDVKPTNYFSTIT